MGGSLLGVLREWGRVYYQTLKPKAAFIFSFINNSVGRGWRVVVWDFLVCFGGVNLVVVGGRLVLGKWSR